MSDAINILPELIEAQGLTLDEYRRIVSLLGREPNLVELGIFGVMWSEHCSYKSSKVHLQRLPTKGDRIVQGPGENAGIVHIGDGWCVAFKIESHNHPSFIEPYQGAATGVGGILRDIFTMGARPVAAMNSLRFGPLQEPANRAIMAGVVKGIGDYGNSFGVPTVGGEVMFADCYSKNPLVNAFALGLVRKDQIFYALAGGVGNAVVYVGAKTGRDGIHGATMASAEFDQQSMQKRPQVQVGDPFTEKLLLEACLEALRTGVVVGMQDMGAAGLTCSSCEMGARAGTGMDINLDLVPQRENGMTAYEIMLSESQERMLLIVKRGYEREIIDVFRKWDLDAVVIGTVTPTERLVVQHEGKVVVDIPNNLLTDEAPVYNRPMTPRTSDNEFRDSLFWSRLKPLKNYGETLLEMLASPNLCSREWIFRQYDHMVRTNSLTLPGGDAAVIRVKETRRAVAMSLDGNGRYCSLNPREGAKLIVAEAARNVVCTGAEPIAITNCLNFASPEHPEVMWDLSEVIDGISEVCRFLNTPVTGGNVSLYNETEGQGIYPTPVIGMVGVIEDFSFLTGHRFQNEGDSIVLIGETLDDLGGSEFLSHICKLEAGPVPRLDLTRERAVQQLCLAAIRAGIVKSAHDCSDGGLAIALVECCDSGRHHGSVGIEIETEFSIQGMAESLLPLAFLFSESPSRIIISLDEMNVEELKRLAELHGVPVTALGKVSGDRFRLRLNQNLIVDEPMARLERARRSKLSSLLSFQAV
jgi:phosphoribosylformylglycinamidine synthase